MHAGYDTTQTAAVYASCMALYVILAHYVDGSIHFPGTSIRYERTTNDSPKEKKKKTAPGLILRLLSRALHKIYYRGPFIKYTTK